MNEITEVKAGDLEQVKNYSIGDLRIFLEGLTSLEGCPKEVTGIFNCNDNYLTSFEHFPKRIMNTCFISRNKFTSFKDIDQHIEYIDNLLYATEMNITSGYSDLFGIDGLKIINVTDSSNTVEADMQNIVNKYLPSKDIINFQDEMIKAGYESHL